jgi:nucleoside-diphosphate-sugar epimerase/putative sterol carrier protein
VKIAVTGAAGQLGTVLLRRLAVERGLDEILAIDLRAPAVASPRVKHLVADVRDPSLAEHLRGYDAIIHLAFIVTGFPPRAVFDDVNINGSRNVFTCAVAAGVKHVVYASSIAAYGVVPGHPVPVVEDTPRVHQPDFAYSAAKFAVEAFLDELEPRHPAVSFVRMRPAILIGTQIENPLGQLLKHRLVFDTGAVPLPLVWDEDVADAMVLAWKKGARGAFNLAADTPLTGAELARACGLRLLPAPASLRAVAARLAAVAAKLKLKLGETDPAWMRTGDVTMIISSDKAKRELGWRPRCATAKEVARRYVAEAPTRLDRRIDLFLRLVQLASARTPLEEGRHLSARVQLRLTGPGGGDVAFIVESGKVTILRKLLRPPTTTVTMRASAFLELLSGDADFGTAQLTGKVRVEGEALAALVVQGLISTFRARASAPGAAGMVPRALARWFGNDPDKRNKRSELS